jgi:hypothetical protein
LKLFVARQAFEMMISHANQGFSQKYFTSSSPAAPQAHPLEWDSKSFAHLYKTKSGRVCSSAQFLFAAFHARIIFGRST